MRNSGIEELEMHGTEIARRLNVTKSTVSRAVARGEKIAIDMKLKLLDS